MTLTEFLLARIAEDEAEIGPPNGRDEGAGPNGIGWAEVGAISEVLMSSHLRALRECEAKRRMVDFIFREAVSVDGEWGDSHDAAEIRAGKCSDQGGKMAEQGLAILAAAYVDHPDYLPEWRV